MSPSHPKRLACDRCRDQKLRCPRVDPEQPPNDPCGRCARARAVCSTSSARPTGRPRNTPTNGSRNNTSHDDVSGASSSSITAANVAVLSAGSGQQKRSYRNQPASLRKQQGRHSVPHTSVPALLSQPATDNTSHSYLTDVADSLMLDSFAADYQTIWEESDAAGLRGLQLFGDGLSSMNTSSDMLPSQNDMQEIVASQGLNFTDPQTKVFGGNNDMTSVSVGPGPQDLSQISESARAMVRLCRVNEAITRQLDSIESYPWAPPFVELECSMRAQDVNGNPISQALKSTAELLAILEDTSTVETNDTTATLGHSPSNSCSDSVSSKTPSTIMILQVSSIYLQLGQLYDTILGHTCTALQSIPRHALKAFQMPMGLQITGMSQIEGILSIKLLIQVIQHQLERVEAKLGLPFELPATEKTSNPKPGGILSGSLHAAELIQTAMRMPDTAGFTMLASQNGKFTKIINILDCP